MGLIILIGALLLVAYPVSKIDTTYGAAVGIIIVIMAGFTGLISWESGGVDLGWGVVGLTVLTAIAFVILRTRTK